MPTPVADTEDKKALLVYVPDEAQSLEFVREIREYLRNNKDKVKVKNMGATGVIEVPVEQYFDAKYKAKTGEVIDGSAASGDRIRVGTVYKKLSFDEYLNMLDEPNKLLRPFAEVNDAGIGTAAAKLKNKIILIYQKQPTGYTLRASFNEELGTTAQPLSTYIFLEWVGGNHYNLLQIKPGKTIPHVTTGGFIEEELIAEGVIDLGEVLEENIENALENTPNKKQYRKKTARNKHNKRNASRKHSHKRK
jgi:hypothetical protein